MVVEEHKGSSRTQTHPSQCNQELRAALHLDLLGLLETFHDSVFSLFAHSNGAGVGDSIDEPLDRAFRANQGMCDKAAGSRRERKRRNSLGGVFSSGVERGGSLLRGGADSREYLGMDNTRDVLGGGVLFDGVEGAGAAGGAGLV